MRKLLLSCVLLLPTELQYRLLETFRLEREPSVAWVVVENSARRVCAFFGVCVRSVEEESQR